jgi:hypothetical protein
MKWVDFEEVHFEAFCPANRELPTMARDLLSIAGNAYVVDTQQCIQ